MLDRGCLCTYDWQGWSGVRLSLAVSSAVPREGSLDQPHGRLSAGRPRSGASLLIASLLAVCTIVAEFYAWIFVVPHRSGFHSDGWNAVVVFAFVEAASFAVSVAFFSFLVGSYLRWQTEPLRRRIALVSCGLLTCATTGLLASLGSDWRPEMVTLMTCAATIPSLLLFSLPWRHPRHSPH